MRRIEHLQFYASTFGLLAISLLAFTKKERDCLVLERDGSKCKAPFPHLCNEKKGVQLHHILPQGYGKHLGLGPDSLDTPENSISLCENAHQMIHPDMVVALKEYYKLKTEGVDAFKAMSEERKAKLDSREIYWNDEYDRQMRVVAMKQTQIARGKGWEFPERRRKDN